MRHPLTPFYTQQTCDGGGDHECCWRIKWEVLLTLSKLNRGEYRPRQALDVRPAKRALAGADDLVLTMLEEKLTNRFRF